MVSKSVAVLGVYTENCTAVFVVQGMFRRLLFANKMVTFHSNVSTQLIWTQENFYLLDYFSSRAKLS